MEQRPSSFLHLMSSYSSFETQSKCPSCCEGLPHSPHISNDLSFVFLYSVQISLLELSEMGQSSTSDYEF